MSGDEAVAWWIDHYGNRLTTFDPKDVEVWRAGGYTPMPLYAQSSAVEVAITPAQAAVIAAAKARVVAEDEYESLRKKGRLARSVARTQAIQRIGRCDEKLRAAVTTLRAQEGEGS